MEIQVLVQTPAVNVDITHRQENQQHLAQKKSNTSFHFALQDVTDEIIRAQSDLDVLDNDQSQPVLEHSSPSVPETQVVVGNSSEFCPILQKDLNLVRHILVQQTDDDNAPFIAYLTKKQRKKLNRSAYKIRLRVILQVLPNEDFLLEHSRNWQLRIPSCPKRFFL